MLGALGVETFRLVEWVLVALRCQVGLREILFSEWDSEKYYSRSGTPRNIILGVGLREIFLSESTLWFGCRIVIGCRLGAWDVV